VKSYSKDREEEEDDIDFVPIRSRESSDELFIPDQTCQEIPNLDFS